MLKDYLMVKALKIVLPVVLTATIALTLLFGQNDTAHVLCEVADLVGEIVLECKELD